MPNPYEDIIPYLKDELEPTERRRFREAMFRDDALRQEVEDVRRTLTLTATIPDVEPTPGVFELVRERLGPQDSVARPSIHELAAEVPKASRRRRRGVGFALTAIATALIVIVAIPGGPEPPPPDLQEAGVIRALEGTVLVSYGADVPAAADPEAPGESGWRAIPDTVIHADTRLLTRVDSWAQLDLADGTTISLGPSSAMSVPPETSQVARRQVRVDRGIVGFAVPTREGTESRIADTASTAVTENAPDGGFASWPFNVATPHGELRVRGTRFSVRVTEDLTLVLVQAGRVDALVAGDGVSPRPIGVVEPGFFAAMGCLPDIEAAVGPIDEWADDEWEAEDDRDPTRLRLLVRPLLRVQLELNWPEPVVYPGRPTPVRVQVKNISPFTLEAYYLHNQDNLRLRYRLLSLDDRVIGGVIAPIQVTLSPGESRWYDHALPQILQDREPQTYQVRAGYLGPLRVAGMAPGEPLRDWQVVYLESYGNPVSLRHAPASDDRNPPSQDGE